MGMPEIAKLAFRFFILALFAIGFAWPAIGIEILAPEPGTQFPSTQWVEVTAVAYCTDPPSLCQNPPPNSRFIMTISAGDGGTKNDPIILEEPTTIKYLCNDYASCRAGIPVQVRVALLERVNEGDSERESGMVPAGIFFTPAQNAPPLISWGATPTMEGNEVLIKIHMSDTDNSPNRLSGIITSDENGQTSEYTTGEGDSLRWTQISDRIIGTMREHEVKYKCINNPCALPLKILAEASDPIGDFSPEIVHIFEAQDVEPNLEAEAQIDEEKNIHAVIEIRSQGNMDLNKLSHSISIKPKGGEETGAGFVEQKRAETLILVEYEYSYDCSACADEVEIIVRANYDGKSLGEERISISVETQEDVQKPEVSVSPSSPKRNQPITATVENTQSVELHEYEWLNSQGETIRGRMDAQLSSGKYKSSMGFRCTENACAGDYIILKVRAKNAEGKYSDYAEKEIRFASSAVRIPDLKIVPSPPKKGENFKIVATSKEQVESHIYSFYRVIIEEDGGARKEPISSKQGIEITAANKISEYAYNCEGTDDCKGQMSVKVKAKSALGESEEVELGILFQIQAPETPILIWADPQNKFENLKTNGYETIAPDGAITMEIQASEEGVRADKFLVEIRRGQEIIQTFGHDLSSGNLRYALDCNPLACQNKESFSISVIPIADGVRGAPLKLSFLIYDANLAYPPGVMQVCATGIGESIRYMGAGLIAMALVIALVYMGGEALNIAHMIEWAKNEALQLAFVPLIFIIIIWLANTVCTLEMGEFFTWAPSLEGYFIKQDMTIMRAAQETLHWGIGQVHLSAAMIRADLGALNMRATRNNYSNQGWFGMNGYSHSDFSGDYTSIGTLTMLLNLNTTFILTHLFQYFSLIFFSASKGFFFALVPIGLIMRSVPFLRAFGGGMVALGVGMFIFYPIVIAFSGLLLAPIYADQDAQDIYAKYYLGATSDVGAMIAGVEGYEGAITGDFGTYVDSYPQPMISGTGFGSPDEDPNIENSRGLHLVNFQVLFNLTAQNFLRAVLIPTAALLVTVAFIANLAIVFGGEIDASRLVQMV